MIVEHPYVQRCFPLFAGVDEQVIVYRRRVRNPDEPAKPKRHRPRVAKAKPHGQDRQVSFWWRDVDLEAPATPPGPEPAVVTVPATPMPQVQAPASPPPAKPKIKRSLHPGKLTRAEKATYQKLPTGWDADRPLCRGDCEGDKPCPWCGKPVTMRISYRSEPATIACPECNERVAYRRRRQGEDWAWQKSDPRHTAASDPDRIPMVARNKCRPCWMIRCQFHLYAEVRDCGTLRLNYPDVPPGDMDLLDDTCALDVADRVDDEGVGREGNEKLALEAVGKKLGLTLERGRQLEAQALGEARAQYMRENSRCV